MASETLTRLHAATKRRRQGYDRAMAAHRAYAEYVKSITDKLILRWETVGCDNPTQNHTGFTNGEDHLVLREPLVFGRLVREPGDALCKPARRFTANLWCDRAGEQPTCKRCVEIAERMAAVCQPGEERGA